jgi:hypothetical protein
MLMSMRGFALVAIALLGCSSPPPASTEDGGKKDASIVDSSYTAPDTYVAPCSEPPPDGGTCILQASGSVTDLADAGLADLVVTVCGAICWGTRTDNGGGFVIPIGQILPTEDYAMHADGRPDHAVDYFRFTHAEPENVSITMHLPALPPSSVLLPPDGASGSSITQGDLTLVIASGTTFDLDIEDFGTGDVGRTFRVASVALADAPAYATAANVDAIYAIAPSSAKSSNKMGVTLLNSAGLAANAAVELLVLGDDYFTTPPNVGILSVVAAAHVSADALTIQTDVGEGISELTWLAVRLKGK